MKRNIKIQNLLLPEVGVCTETSLFYRTDDDKQVEWSIDASQLVFSARRAKCNFSTYFNGLSIAKWKKYTTIGNVRLCLLLKGRFEIVLENHSKVKSHVSHTVVDAKRVDGDGVTPVAVPYTLYDYKGILGFTLIALEENAVFCGGWYEAEVEEDDVRDVNLAVNICTFKREPFIMRNLDLLNRNILKNPEHELFDHLHVFISDNGQTLPLDKLVTDKIHIVPNKNVGGAGGFSRGMMEIMKYRENYPATHVIMMDDDVIIEAESLLRTYNLMRLRKKQYEDMFIGGAMLRLDQPEIQVESGASWNAGKLVSNKSGLDLSELESCIYNEVEEYTEFNAWWYCCTPIQVIHNDNLPLPIFIRGDDLEYGLRNMKTLVLMNGICVWHEPFENKYSSFLQYYILRNMLYDNALHYPKFGKMGLIKRLYRSVADDLIRYRYKDATLTIRGVKDFFKGVDFLLQTDGEKLHKEIMASGYKASPIEDLDFAFHYPAYDISLQERDSQRHRIFRWITLNGYLLPAHKQNDHEAKCVSMAVSRPINYYRQLNILNYDAASGKAFMTQKSYKELFGVLGSLAGLTVKILFSYNSAKKNFRRDSAKVQNDQFWKEYLSK